MARVLIEEGFRRYERQARRISDAGIDIEYRRIPEKQPASSFAEQVRGCEYAIVNGPWTREALAGAKDELKLVVKFGVGVDNIDIPAATELGIAVANAPGANAYAVAEHALALTLAALRGIPAQNARLREKTPSAPAMGGTLEGKTVGLLGFGGIGRTLAKLLSGFPVRVIACDPFMDERSALEAHVERVPPDELARRSDVLSVHVSLSESTRGMVNRAFLSAMKPSSLIVNTSRGAVVDEDALYNALASGHLAGAALDVFADEPVSPDHPLLSLPNVIATPHTASNTPEAFEKIMDVCADNVIAFSKGIYRNVLNEGALRARGGTPNG